MLGDVVPNWKDWLVSWLPALELPVREIGEPDTQTLASLLQLITLHLQSRTDLQVSFGKVMPTAELRVLRIITQYDEEAMAAVAFLRTTVG